MINNRQAGRRNRGRNNNNNGRPNGGNRGGGDNGNRIDNRARGNAAQLLEKYKNMARDAQMAGDRVNAEYYLQFADHYFRVLADNRSRQEEQQQRFRRNDENFDDEGEEFEDAARIAASLVVAGSSSRYPVLFRTSRGDGADISANGEGLAAALKILAEAEPHAEDPGLNSVIRFAEGIEGVSLGAVTGRPASQTAVGVTRARSRFDMVSVFQLGLSASMAPLAIPGALVVGGLDSEEVAGKWMGMFG